MKTEMFTNDSNTSTIEYFIKARNTSVNELDTREKRGLATVHCHIVEGDVITVALVGQDEGADATDASRAHLGPLIPIPPLHAVPVDVLSVAAEHVQVVCARVVDRVALRRLDPDLERGEVRPALAVLVLCPPAPTEKQIENLSSYITTS